MSSDKKKKEESKDTWSKTHNEAYNQAKKVNNIPQSSPPTARRIVPEMSYGSPTGRMVREDDYQTRDGKSVTFRHDPATTYPDGGTQGPHYNVGLTGEKLKQHHYYEKKP